MAAKKRKNGARLAHEAIRAHVKIASCYNLLMQEARNRVGKRTNLTLPQFDVLAELARAGPSGFRFIELSRLLLVTSGNLTGIVDRLERRKLVKREPDKVDRRVIRVKLTSKGRTLTDQILPRHTEDIGDILSFMSPESLRKLNTLLDELKQGLLQNHSKNSD